MKKLLLVRHATAANPTHTCDFERPLTTIGHQQASELGKKLREANLSSELIVASPALRAKTTAQLIAAEIQLEEPKLLPEIYEAPEHMLLKSITAFAPQLNYVSMVGHNPGLSYLATYLTGLYFNLSPGSAVLLKFDAEEWAMITSESGKVLWFNEPES